MTKLFADRDYLRAGAVVRAAICLCEAKVDFGTEGVVYIGGYGDKAGPYVRWFTGQQCAVKPGDVEVVIP